MRLGYHDMQLKAPSSRSIPLKECYRAKSFYILEGVKGTPSLVAHRMRMLFMVSYSLCLYKPHNTMKHHDLGHFPHNPMHDESLFFGRATATNRVRKVFCDVHVSI